MAELIRAAWRNPAPVTDPGLARAWQSLSQFTWALPWGTVNYAEITAQSALITAIADVASLTVTFEAVPNRRYRTTFFMSTQVGATPQDEEMYIILADAANTQLNQGRFAPNLTTKNAPALTVLHISNTSYSGTRTHKVRAQALTGSFRIFAAATQPAFIHVEDIGPLPNT